MRKPKTKPIINKPKTLDNSIKKIDKTKQVTKKIDEQLPDTQNDSAQTYAVDNATQLATFTGTHVIKSPYETVKSVKQAKNRYDEYQSCKENEAQNSYDSNASKPKSSKTKQPFQAQNNTHSTNKDKNIINDYPKSKNEVLLKQRDYSRQKYINNENKLNISDKEINKNKLIKNENLLNKIKPKTKQNAKALANSKKAVKSVKNTKRSIKNVRQTAKATKQAAKATAKTTRRIALRAKQFVKATFVATKATAKAFVSAIKGIILATKSLIALMIAGGWVTIIVIISLAIIGLIASSPWGMFIDDGDDTNLSISQCIALIDSEYTQSIAEIISNAGDVDQIVYEGDSDATTIRAGNWVDVLGIFSILVTSDENNPSNVMIMNDDKMQILSDVFWSMNSITYRIEETEVEPDPTLTPTSNTPDEPTPEPTPETERKLYITLNSMPYENGIDIYSFNEEKITMLEELMSPEYYPLFMELCGMNSFVGLTPDQINNLINDLPIGTKGTEIVKFAISRLGHPYSQPKRGQGNFVDCSYLTRWCYQQAGVSHFTAGTAAEQTRYCVDNGLAIAYSDLQAGDLIFWSFNPNGRFMDVTHTGIYVGDGMVIDASSSRGMVVYRNIFGIGNIVACGRPHVR